MEKATTDSRQVHYNWIDETRWCKTDSYSTNMLEVEWISPVGTHKAVWILNLISSISRRSSWGNPRRPFFSQKLSVHCAGTRAKKRVRFGKAAVMDSQLREDLHSNNMMMLLQHIPHIHQCPLPSAGLEWEKADKQLYKRPKKTNCCSNCRLQNTIAFVSLCTSTRKETGGELSSWKMWLKDTIHHLILEYPEILWHVAAFLSLNRKRGMLKILCIHTVHETLSVTALFVTQCNWFI